MIATHKLHGTSAQRPPHTLTFARSMLAFVASLVVAGCSGGDGRDGVQGGEGAQGPAGPAGVAGPKGEPGLPGTPGSVGAPGRDGSDGAPGLPMMVWRGAWSESVAYLAGDAVRSVDGTTLFVTVAPSENVAPSLETSEWSVVLSTKALAPPPCPEGMGRIDSRTCADLKPRNVPVEAPETFTALSAHLACRAADARLCTLDENLLRAQCDARPDDCQTEPRWADHLDTYVAYCNPMIVYPSALDVTAAVALPGQFVFTENEAFLRVNFNRDVSPATFNIDAERRDTCERLWGNEGVAEILCCTDI